MGATIAELDWEGMVLRPFSSSQSYQNLVRSREGVFHITDNAEMIAQAAVGRLATPSHRPADSMDGVILNDACRWYALRVETVEDDSQRPSLHCRVVSHGTERPFLGFCRAKHAVLEAAILATRVHLLSIDSLRSELLRLRPLVQKTGGDAEHRAFALLTDYIEHQQADP
jgi:hypothetical protein